MNRLRDQLLARAALALNQHSRAAGRDLRYEVEETKHRLALADDIFKVVALLQRPLKLNDLFFGAVAPHRGTNIGEQLFVIPRLLNEILRACTDRVDNVADRPERGDHNHGKAGLHLQNSRQKLDSGLSRQSEIEQQQIVFIACEQIQPRGAVVRRIDRESFQRQQSFQRLANRVLIIDDENSRLADDPGVSLKIGGLRQVR